MEWHIGCSGFSYKEWKDVFYPAKLPANQWFRYYCSKFNTVEINLTFYNFPKKNILEGWYNKSPGDFVFSVKAPRLITHYKKMQDVQSLLSDFYSVCRDGLQDKLGPVLFQFPSSFSFTEERLQLITDNLSNSYTNVVEFRHAGWWQEKIYTELSNNKIVFAGISHPSLPDDVIASSPVLYYRFHGVPKLYYSGYSQNTLKHFADSVINNKKIKKIFCYFNNTGAVEAIHNAQYLIDYVSTFAHPGKIHVS